MLKLPRITSDFTKNVLKLMSGTALAHIATFIATPLLTRLFAKESLGELQLFISTITTFGVVSSLKYELAIVIPKDDDDGNALAVLSLISLLLFSLLFTLMLTFVGGPFLRLFDAESLQPYLYFLALGVFLFGLMQSLQYVLVRHKKFGALATNKIVQVASTQILAVTLGFFSDAVEILLYTQVLGYLLAALLILNMKVVRFNVSWSRLWQLARTNKKFPTINTSMVFLNTLSLQLPVFMLSRYFTTEVVALYSMANRLINIPLFMIGRSVQQVYFQSASEAFHISKNRLLFVYKKTIVRLAAIAIIPLVIVLLAGPWIAGLYLGSAYTEAGVYMQIITFWMFFQFITSPVSQTFTIIDRQEVGFYLIVASLLVRLLAMSLFNTTPREMLFALSIAAGLFYLFYNLYMYILIKPSKSET